MSDVADLIATIRAVLNDEDQFNQICEDTFTEFDKDGSGELDTVIDIKFGSQKVYH